MTPTPRTLRALQAERELAEAARSFLRTRAIAAMRAAVARYAIAQDRRTHF